jgi:hypothetical protein
MPMMRKPLNEVTRSDVEALCEEQWLEDEQIDFKRTVPHKDGVGNDPWHGQCVIKDYGRDQLLATVVAFANSYGGDLLVGVKEADGSQPGRAEALQPLAACEDLAHRLGQMARDCIDPPLPNLQVRGITVAEDGSGVVILRAQQSRAAPHRLRTVHGAMKECFHRVRHETVAMTMHQIQDLTFSVSRGLEAVDRRFSELRESSDNWLRVNPVAGELKRFCLRVAAVPANSSVYLERVHNIAEVRPGQRSLRVQLVPDSEPVQLVLPFEVHNWRPALRASEAESYRADNRARVSVHCDGAVSYDFFLDAPVSQELRGRSREFVLYPGWHFALLVNAVEAADRFRVAAGASVVDYGLEVEITADSDLPVLRFGNRFYDPAGTLSSGPTLFPRYVIGPPETWTGTLNLIYRDFWNAIGIDTANDDFRVLD